MATDLSVGIVLAGAAPLRRSRARSDSGRRPPPIAPRHSSPFFAPARAPSRSSRLSSHLAWRADNPPRYPSPQLNSKRLKAYKASLILCPRRTAKPKAGDSEAAELNMARQLKGKLMPITKEDKPLEMVTVTDDMKAFTAYHKLRTERMNVWQVGPRIKKAEEAAKKAEEDAKVAKMK